MSGKIKEFKNKQKNITYRPTVTYIKRMFLRVKVELHDQLQLTSYLRPI